MNIALWTVTVTVAVAIGLVVTLLVARAIGRRRRQARAEVTARLRPAIVRLLADDEDVAIPNLTRTETPVFEALASEFLIKVRGEGHDRLAAMFVESGAVAAAERRSRQFGAGGRAAAATFLGTVGDVDGAPAVRPLLRDRALEVRIAAARALGRIGRPDDVPALLASLEGDRPVPFATVADSLTQLGPDAIPHLRTALRGPNLMVRAAAAEVLGLLGAVDSTEDLLAHIHPVEDDEVRIRCARALGRIGTPRAVEPLARLVSPSEVDAVRAVAVRALGRVGAAGVVDRLSLALDDEVHQVASNGAEALVECGPPGLATLRQRATEPGRGAAYAREALARASIGAGETPA
jgi:HEAT repeat protein